MSTRHPGITCPHCDAKAIVRSSKQVGAMTRDLTYVCTDDDCGHRFVAQLSVTHSTRLSERPRANVHLPFRPSSARPANDSGTLKSIAG